MARPPYTRGLHELGDGLQAWLQPDGGWGWSNAGLVTGDGASLLVDTLFDLRLTREMLDAMGPLTAPAPIETLVNTHANGDHCYGNELVVGAEIVASDASAREMGEITPQVLHSLLQLDLGEELGSYLQGAFGPFRFEGISVPAPSRTFTGSLDLSVGGRVVELIEVGPAHTAGDVLVHVPDAATVFTGDILFIGGTPIVWAGPVSNWIRACDTILALGAHTVVPGHGPVTDDAGVRDVRGYLEWVLAESRSRHQAGMSAEDAARDIDLGPYREWGEWERLAVNVDAAYRELDPTYVGADVITQFSRMAALARR